MANRTAGSTDVAYDVQQIIIEFKEMPCKYTWGKNVKFPEDILQLVEHL